MYPPELVAPMKEELVSNGFSGLESANDVQDVLSKKEGTTFLVVNSVCGCAAGTARPGAVLAVKNAEKKPDNMITVFAGVDREAVDKAREYLMPYPPSSPAMAVFKDGELVHMIERHHIEGRPAEMIAENLLAAFDEFCEA